ncbi:PilZ domain-containing protein [Geomonas sp. RF6]|uniref:PilZ domain-containing protein n=1 Tax=Geomonas sp. RF6 TaxID=2897342 RepID=UPI001E6156C1|nr:PilZ domain-containing protein [Geomonas sp. RF6]UFS69223.1 PilZ domain-containing protein [Geomonas sp. RF6]
MPDTNILLVVKGEDARSAYEEALCRIGVGYEVASSFGEALKLSIERAFSGVVIDILTLVRSDKDEKLIAYDCINLYPSIRVKWDGRKKEINLSLLEQSFVSDSEASLRYFVEHRCRNFPPRSLRKYHRTTICLSVYLCVAETFSEKESAKSFTVNLSRGGAFVHTTVPLAKGETVWLSFPGFDDPAPIRCRVCWSIPWGSGRSIPGVGVCFESLSETQSAEVAELSRG